MWMRPIVSTNNRMDTPGVSTLKKNGHSPMMTDGTHPESKRRQPERRLRRWSRETKRQAVEETFAAGMSVSIVARRYDINTNQLFTWRRQYYRGELGDIGRKAVPRAEFVQVALLDHAGAALPSAGMKQLPAPAAAKVSPAVPVPSAAPLERASRPGRIELELGNGMKLKLHGEVNAASLRQVLSVLRETA